MSTFYTGIPGNVVAGNGISNAVSVVGATNAHPIVITTATPHNYNTGDLVAISFASVNTAANGLWKITVLTSTTFSLGGSWGNGVFTGAAIAINQALNPPYAIPSDGDAFNAAAFNVALEALGDRTAYLQRLNPSGMYNLVSQSFSTTTDDTFSTWSTTSASTTGWQTLTSTTDPFGLSANPQYCNANDLFIYNFTTTLQVGANVTAIGPGLKVAGAALNAYQVINGSAQQFQNLFHGGINVQGFYAVAGYGGSTATISSVSSPIVTMTGLSGISSALNGAWITISGCANPGNNGTFYVNNTLTSTSLQYVNNNAVAPDANSGGITWLLNNMTFNAAIMGFGNAGTPPSIVLSGHRTFVLSQYRPSGPVLYPTG